MSTTPAETADAPLNVGGLTIAPGERVGQYVYRRVVGSGGMAQVALATDPDGNPVALKILKSGRVSSGAQRFRREFRALAKLRHPNVIRVDAYGDLHGHPYIAMEYVQGTDLHQLIHALGSVPHQERYQRCEQVLADIARALVYIHARGLVHRDLKPSNVLIDGAGRCKLTDFGIVKDLGPENESQASTTLVGTWAYASPEQVNGQPIDHRSDLFSLGVMLFAMLTGRRPFVAKDLGGYVELHRSHVAPAPADVEPDVPAHLDEICRRLMAKDPRRRPRGAQEVLFRLEVAPDATPAASRWTPPAVGRQPVVDAIADAVAALTRKQGGVVVVEGEEGSGRSTMLQAAADAARVVGLGIHRVRVGRPDGAMGVILRLAESVRSELGPDAATALGDAAREAVEAAGGGSARTRLYDLLAESFARLSRTTPQVVIVDDVHAALLPALDGCLHVARALATEPVCFVLGLDATVHSPRLDAMRVLGQTISLSPLSVEESVVLSASLLGGGKASEAIGTRLHAETGGNPGATVDWLLWMVGTGLVERHARGWRLVVEPEEIADGHLDVPPAVGARIRPRIDALDLADRALADALAVYGHEAELEVLLEVLDLGEEAANESLYRLDQDGLVRVRSAGPHSFAVIARPLLRTVLYRSLGDDRRAHLHRAFATALERRFGQTVTSIERVAQHWTAAGEVGRAYLQVVAGAKKMRERGLNAEAWELTDRALELEDTARVDLDISEFAAARQELLLARAEVWYLRGKWTEAREVLTAAVSLAERVGDDRGAVRARMRLSRVLRTAGKIDDAEAMVVANLARARDLGERESIAEGLLVRAHIAWSRGNIDDVERHAQDGLIQASAGQSPRARADLLLALTAVQCSRGQLASAASGLMEAQTLYRDLRMHGMRAAALANLAEVELGQGDPVSAWEHGADAIAETEAEGAGAGGPPSVAAHRIRGLAALELGAWSEATAELLAALAKAEAMDIRQERLACAVHLARTRLATGDATAAVAALEDAEAQATGGDPERFLPSVHALRARALAALREAGPARAAVVEAEASLGNLPPQRRIETSLDLARALERLGDAAVALPLAQAAVRLAQSRGFRMLYLDATALAARVCADAAESNRLAREAQGGYAGIMSRLPSAWQSSFRSRGGGA